MPVGRLVTSGGMMAVRQYYENLGQVFISALNDMLVFDAVIINTDRHFGNFGFMIDNNTNKIVAPAPLFDHGNSLLNFAGRDDLENNENLKKYADTLLPCVYDDFIKIAKKAITQKHREGLRKLLKFKFKKNSKYNLPDQRLKMLEIQIPESARILLEK